MTAFWEPAGWEANTGVAGTGHGCNRLFRYKEEAIAYLAECEPVGVMGGRVEPVYRLPRFFWKNPTKHLAVIRPPLVLEPKVSK